MRFRPAFCVSLLLLLTTVASPAAIGSTPDARTLPIERKFQAGGPWSVTTAKGVADVAGSKVDVWYPTDLGRDGFRHPIVTWGNGTGAVPNQYAHLLAHFASWGFVVVASEHTNTGTGKEILATANWAVSQNEKPSSVFFHKLATDKVGAVGHSQGASGVLNAMRDSAGAITTAVPLEIAGQVFCLVSQVCADSRKLTGGSVFYVNGSADTVISPSKQALPWQVVGLQSNAAYYDATPASVSKVWATLNGANHNDVQGQPDCAKASKPCGNGVYGYLGYPTAWLVAQLQGDGVARQAFVNGTGELFQETQNWANQSSSIAK